MAGGTLCVMDQEEIRLREKIVTLLNLLIFNDDKVLSKTELFISEKFEDFLDLLTDLKHCLLSQSSVDSTLKKFPDICQLLDRLCNISILTLHSNINNLLIDCILNLYVQVPSTPLEKKANKWVISQLRNFLCVGPEEKTIFEHLGLKPKSVSHRAISVLRQHVLELKAATGTLEGRPVPCDVFVTSWGLEDTCLMLIYLLHNPDPHICFLVDTFMDYFSTQPCKGAVLEFYRKLTNLQQDIYKDECKSSDARNGNVTSPGYLSDRSRSKLWSCYLPSLEHDILSLVTKSIEWTFSIQRMRKLIDSRQLPQSCARDYQLFYETTNIFHSIANLALNNNDDSQHSGKSAVLEVLAVFYDSVLSHLSESSRKEESISLYSLYPQSLHELVNQYEMIPYQDVSCCIRNISTCIQRLKDQSQTYSDLIDVWLLCQHFRLKFLRYFLKQTFIVPEPDIDCFITVLLWFYQPVISNHKQVKSLLCVFLRELRLVFWKDKVLWSDIEGILPDVTGLKNESLIKAVTGSLLIALLVYSDGELSLFKNLLEIMAGHKDLNIQAFLLLCAQTFLQFEPVDITSIRTNYVKLVSYYCLQIEREILTDSSSTMLSQGDLDRLVLSTSNLLIACKDVIDGYSH